MKNFTILAVVFTLLSFSAQAQTNLLAEVGFFGTCCEGDANPGFEGFDGGTNNVYWWGIYQYNGATGNRTVSTANPHSGSNCLIVNVTNVTAANSDIQIVSDKRSFSITAGTSYTMRYWAKGAVGGEMITTSLQQNMSPYGGFYSGTGPLGTDWALYTNTFTPTVTSTYSLKFFMGSTVGTYYVDDVELFPTSTLPVELLSFQANAKNKTVGLNWQVADEKQIKNYSIERSAEGQKFTPIGLVEAQNSSSQTSYAFNDENPFKGINYYRLKINEQDGTFKYSKVQSVRTGASNKALIYPNPTSDYIQVKNTEGVESVLVYDISGRLVRQFLNNTTSQLDISALPKGVYQVAIKANGETGFSRVVKM